jgi:hypothetical protein
MESRESFFWTRGCFPDPQHCGLNGQACEGDCANNGVQVDSWSKCCEIEPSKFQCCMYIDICAAQDTLAIKICRGIYASEAVKWCMNSQSIYVCTKIACFDTNDCANDCSGGYQC